MSEHDDALADLEAFITDFGGSLPAGAEDGVAFAALELRALGVDAPIGGSRFGGFPDVAEGFAWPEARGVTGSPILEESLDPARIEAWGASPEHARSGRRMVFLAQIAWADVSWSDPDLPASGRAYLFVGLAAEAGLDVALVHDDSEVSALRPSQSGSGKLLDWSVGTNGMVSSRALHMRPRMSPSGGDDTLLAALARRPAAVRVCGEQPHLEREVTHLAEQALGGNDWMLLFRVDSVPECGVRFQTYGNTTLAIAIRRSDLQRRDFSSVFSHLVGQLPGSSSPTAPPFTSGMAGLWKTPLRTGATDQAIAATQARLGFRLPASYVALMKQSNGGLLIENSVQTNPEHYPYVVEKLKAIEDLPDAEEIDEWGFDVIGVFLTSLTHDGILLDYRLCGRDGEPSVVYVQQSEEPVFVAPDFGSFVALLLASPPPPSL